MYVIAGFESQIAAQGGALAIAEAARRQGVGVMGAALARVDTQRSIHIVPHWAAGPPARGSTGKLCRSSIDEH